MNELLHIKVRACQNTDGATIEGIKQDPLAGFSHPGTPTNNPLGFQGRSPKGE